MSGRLDGQTSEQTAEHADVCLVGWHYLDKKTGTFVAAGVAVTPFDLLGDHGQGLPTFLALLFVTAVETVGLPVTDSRQ